MLKKIKRKIEKNPLDALLNKAKRKNKKKFLLAWNRALGDVSLGLYAVVYRIKQYIKDAEITFLIRENLKEAFELLEGIDFIIVPFWRRYVPFDIYHSLKLLNIDHKYYDIILDKADPTYWVKWQLSSLVPKLIWKKNFDDLHTRFELPQNKILVGVQPTIETKHSPWRKWPKKYFDELFKKASKNVVFVLFGTKKDEKFEGENIIDLRGQTKLLEVLSILKNRCSYFISLDSGLLSLFYFLNVDFPIKLITLWGSKDVGIMKQNVLSPNKKLIHIPLLYENLIDLKPKVVFEHIYPNDIEKILKENKQKILLEKFQEFTFEKNKSFINEIFSINLKVLEKQKAFFLKKRKKENFLPLKKSHHASLKDYKIGKKIISSLPLATIIMAAGQGSRLGFFGPKGLFEINKKTLFEYLIEKIINKQKKYNAKLYISIMTSHLNHLQTIEFFNKNLYFGLNKDQIDFIIQRKAPFLDEKGNWIFEGNKILQSPDGNGSIFTSFNESGILSKYLKKGIRYISIVPIDNPLCDPFDEALFGFHKNKRNEVTIKCIKRESHDEKKGAIALVRNKIKVVEYIDLDKNKTYYFSNSGIYLMNFEFFQKMKDKNLKYHFVLKKMSNTNEILAYKSESFIFDSFEYAKNLKTLVDKKENFYAPIKDLSNLKEIEKLLSNIRKTSISMIK